MLNQEDKKWMLDTFASKVALDEFSGELKKGIIGLEAEAGRIAGDFTGLKTDVADLKTDVAGLKTGVAGLKTDSELIQHGMVDMEKRLGEKIDEGADLSRKASTAAGNFGGRVASLEQENKVGASIMRRHDLQIATLAKKTETALPE